MATNYAKQICSIMLAKRNISYIFSCGKLREVYMNYLTEACVLIDNPANHLKCRRMIEETYYLCKLEKNMTDVKLIRAYCKSKFNIVIE